MFSKVFLTILIRLILETELIIKISENTEQRRFGVTSFGTIIKLKMRVRKFFISYTHF